jgi:leucyl aminopeptidase
MSLIINTTPSFQVDVLSGAGAQLGEPGTSAGIVLFLKGPIADIQSFNHEIKSALAAIFTEESHRETLLQCLHVRTLAAWRSRESEEPLKDTLFVDSIVGQVLVSCALVPVTSALEPYERLMEARTVASKFKEARVQRVFVTFGQLSTEASEIWLDAFVSATILQEVVFYPLSSKKKARRNLEVFEVRVDSAIKERLQSTAKQAFVTSTLTSLAKQLAILPSNVLTAEAYRDFVKQEVTKKGLGYEFYDVDKLKTLGAGAFLAVVAADEGHQCGILKASYKPSNAKGKLSLVGKGVIFDTGGVNLKSAKSMYGMHGDMQGSAIALATFLSLVDEKFPYEVELFLAIGENKIGPQGYKPGDVVTAMNGTTIEVMHTDAEGRMLLADTLTLAARGTPELIIDFATLTGACVVAIGTRYHGVYTSNIEWLGDIHAAGKESGERVWVFPNDEDFGDALKSKVADIKQCTIESSPDHILAGHFLRKFTEKVPWVHVDLSASEDSEGVAHSAGPFTGIGVRFVMEFLRRWDSTLRGK